MMVEKGKNIQVIVVGGGLAGLLAAISLQRAGIATRLFEKKEYPFHRVCGEYISNEVKPFLQRMHLYPEHLEPSSLNKFKLSDIQGNHAEVPLPLGGFGISRYQLDQFLYQQALRDGVRIEVRTEVENISFSNNNFTVELKDGKTCQADFVINAYGKRSRLDKQFDRQFIKKQSPFIGVKYHAYVDFPKDVIGLYNFPGGYCGVSHVEDNMVNICYLSERKNLKAYQNIKAMERELLYQNPELKRIFQEAKFVRKHPEVINEISFDKKDSVENHMLMAGDTAGLITPLCGNGMAMAIHSGYLAAESIHRYKEGKLSTRSQVEDCYRQEWQKHFAKRLWVGRRSQYLFGKQWRAYLAVKFIKNFPSVAQRLIAQTHGQAF